MNGAEVLDVGRDAIWLTIQLCLPVLLVGLVVGVVIGVIQAAMNRNHIDPTLTKYLGSIAAIALNVAVAALSKRSTR